MAAQKQKMATGHTAGIFADMTLDGPEIGTLVVVVDRAKNLPNRRTMGKQDPYCAMRLGKEAKKTGTDRRGGQTPRWDQELRFTVHDSPDYYQLKTSVFNDDKKTDLIGEAYLDLKQLIKPGGGKNDHWHQLSYRGKYAGDIRVELTYYDMRPREEKHGEKRRHKEKSTSLGAVGLTGSPSGPRQLGPRDVQRRPLPASPGESTSQMTNQAPVPPPKIPLDTQSSGADGQPHSHNANGFFSAQSSAQDDPYLSNEPHYGNESQYVEQLSRNGTQETDWEPSLYIDYDAQHGHTTSAGTTFVQEAADWSGSQRRPSGDIIHTELNEQSHAHAELSETTVASIHMLGAEHFHPHEVHLPATTSAPFSNNRHRQSFNPQDVSGLMTEEPESFDSAPPPPPRHSSGPRTSQPNYIPPSFAPLPLRPMPLRPSVEERSPLQILERQFETQGQTPSAESLVRPAELAEIPVYDLHQQSHRESNAAERTSQLPSAAHSRGVASRKQHDQSSTASREPDFYAVRNVRHSFGEERPVQRPAQARGRADSYDDREYRASSYVPETYSSRGTHSQPELTAISLGPHEARPQPLSRSSNQAPGRKTVGSEPHPDPRRWSGAPFGPDSYDVLNPSSSSVTNEKTLFETPEQAKEAARMREVQRLRDQGPIIGNDGREIDPTDHLPADTWAPEPDRKQRKPEHVVHYRTRKDNGRQQTQPGFIPAPVKKQAPKTMPSANSPATLSSTSSSPSFGPLDPSVAPRAQKPMSTRPLPAYPYQPPRVESVPTTPLREFPPQESAPRSDPPRPRHHLHQQQQPQRNSYHEHSAPLHRPALSEYQVSPTNVSNVPRGSYYQQEPRHTPPKMPCAAASHPFSPYDDLLAAEMSMIDIGPSRAPRTAMRAGRAY